MKRMLSVCLVLALFFALLPGAGAEESFRFTRENFPKLDGSTSMVPLGQRIASVLLGERREDAGKTAPACGLYLEQVFYDKKEAGL